MDRTPDWGLRFRMIASVVLLLAVTAAFVGVVWLVLAAISVLVVGSQG